MTENRHPESEDAWEYGSFDDRFIYQELALSAGQRCLPMTGLLREESIEVWMQYQEGMGIQQQVHQV